MITQLALDLQHKTGQCVKYRYSLSLHSLQLTPQIVGKIIMVVEMSEGESDNTAEF